MNNPYNNFYIRLNGKLHDLIRRCEDLQDELDRQIAADTEEI